MIEVGQRFDFVTAAGTRKRYVVTETEDNVRTGVSSAALLAKLRNLDTNGYSRVTHKWLTEEPDATAMRGHWEPVA